MSLVNPVNFAGKEELVALDLSLSVMRVLIMARAHHFFPFCALSLYGVGELGLGYGFLWCLGRDEKKGGSNTPNRTAP